MGVPSDFLVLKDILENMAHTNNLLVLIFFMNLLTLRSTFCEVTTTNTFAPWTYQCGPENFCMKLASPGDSQGISLTECKLTCGEHLQLWPRPNGDFEFDRTVTTFNPENIKVIFSENTRLIAQEWFNDT